MTCPDGRRPGATDINAEQPRSWQNDPMVRRILRNAGYLDEDINPAAPPIATRR